MAKWRWLGLVVLMSLVIHPIGLAQEATPTSTPIAAPAGKLTLRVWWSDAMYPLNDEGALRILESLLAEFNRTNEDDLEVIVRLKPSEGDSNILNTLVAAQPVAPNAMPDLVLIPSDDLFRASRSNLIRQLDEWVPDSLLNDVPTNVLALGKVGDTMYGLPYAVVIEHSVLKGDTLASGTEVTFDSLLEAKLPFFFPAQPMPTQVVNDLLLAQYLAAGGALQDENGLAHLDEPALLEVLNFYGDGVKDDLFGPEMLGYVVPQSYWSQFVQGNAGAAMTESSLYLRGFNTLAALSIAPLPSSQPEGVVILEGWVWAITTLDPNQQMAALRFVEWLMNAENQADYTQAFGMLPSRLRALRLWSAQAQLGRYEQWLQSGVILPLEQRNNTAAAQLQLAFEAVLDGVPPAEAAKTALNNLQSAN